MDFISSALTTVTAEEGDLISRDHSTLMVRNFADVVLLSCCNAFPAYILVALAGLKLCNLGQIDTPE